VGSDILLAEGDGGEVGSGITFVEGDSGEVGSGVQLADQGSGEVGSGVPPPDSQGRCSAAAADATNPSSTSYCRRANPSSATK
jgi:hypothetical protein